MKNKILIFLLLYLFPPLFAQTKGTLFIIGGGSISEGLIEKYVDLAGGKDSKFLIIPLASAEPLKAANSFTKKLVDAGCKNIESIISKKENIDNDSNLAKLKDVKGVFFTGGDQSKLTAVLLNSKVLDMIKNIFSEGGVIGGTSAGAAVMSKVMITGEELVNKDSTNSYNIFLKGNIETAKGFGFIKNAIVDQHFIKRKRMIRLFSLVLENPNLLGIGIDESTAIIVHNKEFEVMGESCVMVIDASKAKQIEVTKNGYLSGDNIKIDLLKNGDKFNFESHRIIPN